VIPLLEKICGPEVRVIDPAPAVARQTMKVAGEWLRVAGGEGRSAYFTSGDVAGFERVLERLWAERGAIRGVQWLGDAVRLVMPQSLER
jgi:glutamate racemase